MPSNSAPTILQKICARCGAPFGCQQAAGCWCSTLRLDPATLAKLRAQFSDCLCEPCLQTFATNQTSQPTIETDPTR